MTTPSTEEITGLLLAWREGDQTALEHLAPLVYEELHRLAAAYMRQERPGHLLQTTALVHEAYLRLTGYHQIKWQNRTHFFAISAQLMRRILVEFARARRTAKRGGEMNQVSLAEALPVAEAGGPDLVALDDALCSLAKLDPRQSRVVELRFFGGLSYEEIAEVLKVSEATIRRDWSLAQAWLYTQLNNAKSDDT
jgi:RNA polymerase sigma factor (TIGR02999 family)